MSYAGSQGRPVSVVLAMAGSLLVTAGWAVLTTALLVNAVNDSGIGLLFAAVALGMVAAWPFVLRASWFARVVAALFAGSRAGGNLLILLTIAPMFALAWVFGVRLGQVASGILWLGFAAMCAACGALAAAGVSARRRSGIGCAAAGPGVVALVISTLFTLGMVFGDDPWSDWVYVGYAIGGVTLLAELLWMLPPADRYVTSLMPQPDPSAGGPAHGGNPGVGQW